MASTGFMLMARLPGMRPAMAPEVDTRAWTIAWERTARSNKAKAIAGANPQGTAALTNNYLPTVQFTSDDKFKRAACYGMTVDWPPVISDKVSTVADYVTADEETLVHADGTYPRFLAKLARIDVLILDDWGLVPVGDSERRDLLEIIEDRYGNRSTILTSQLPSAKWHDHVGDPTIADAICDRLLHNAHEINLEGESRRKQRKTRS